MASKRQREYMDTDNTLSSKFPKLDCTNMVPAQKLRDGLFSISWGIQNVMISTTSSVVGQVAVNNLREVFEYCVLTVTVDLERETLGLEMEAIFPETINFPDLFKNITVQATMDGIQQKLTLKDLKWTTSWFYSFDDTCGGCLWNFGFHILIDLAPCHEIKKANHAFENLSKLWESKSLSDVSVKCRQETFEAHTCILASGSPVLEAMFQSNWKETRERILKIEDVAPKVLNNLIRFIYTGEAVFLEKEEAEDLLIAAEKYAVDSLKEECAVYLSQFLSVENAVHYLILAHLHNSQNLHKSALDFIAKNAKGVCSQKIWLDLMKNFPDLCFQATQFIAGSM